MEYVDYIHKTIYIMACKCGTTTISHMLNMLNNDSNVTHNTVDINNPKYKKIIIMRKCVIDRFLSGFYEDLFNNSCYNNMNITFNNYLLFLHKCYKEKLPNVGNLFIYNGLDMPVWFGNCSNVIYNITVYCGNFCSHIASQKYAICHVLNNITCTNIEIIELNELHILLPNIKKCNVKPKVTKIPVKFDNISNMLLPDIKSNRIIIAKELLNENQKQIILDIYKEDVDFLMNLENKYLYVKNINYKY